MVDVDVDVKWKLQQCYFFVNFIISISRDYDLKDIDKVCIRICNFNLI